jgi:hypothetical protein
MTPNNIKGKIKRKIEEHKTELVGATQFREDLANTIKTTRDKLTKIGNPDIVEVKNMFGIYEKMKFHKICIDVLKDLLVEIENEEESQKDQTVSKA